MTCRSLMVEPAVRLKPTATVAESVRALLESNQPALPVADDAGKLLGTFGLAQALALLLPSAARLGADLGDLAYVHEGLGDLAARFTNHGHEPVRRHMAEPVAVRADCQAMEALLLLSRGEGFLAVIDDHHKLLGVITSAKAVAAVSEGR